jgi:hypothetical protein
MDQNEADSGDQNMKPLRIARLSISLSLFLGVTTLSAMQANGGNSSKASNTNSSQPQPPAASQTGPEAVPVVYNGKYTEFVLNPSDDSCRSKLVQNLWGLLDPDGKKWKLFQVSEPASDLKTAQLPQMNRFVWFGCKHEDASPSPQTPAPKKEEQKSALIVHGSLWKMGTTPGTWSQVTSQWQVYRPAPRWEGEKAGIPRGILANGYTHPRENDVPSPSPNGYQQPSAVSWLAKPPLYNDKHARFIGISCFYDWDGHSLEDATRIKDITVSYKISTVAVVPDNISNLNSILGALFPGTGLAGATERSRPVGVLEAHRQPPNSPDFDQPPATVVPGDQVRFRVIGVPQSQFTWSVEPYEGTGAAVDVSIDNYGTLKVSAGATQNAIYKITATRRPGSAGGKEEVAYVRIAMVLPCLVASGSVDISSLPSDITVALTVQDASQNAPAVPSLTAVGDTDQSAEVSKPFKPLKVLLKDANGKPWSGVTVNFTAPTSGASATLTGSSASTDQSGIAGVTATANQTQGQYAVFANTGALSVSFNLQNTPVKPTVTDRASTDRRQANLESRVEAARENTGGAASPDQAVRGGNGGGKGKNAATPGNGGGDTAGGSQNGQSQTSDCSSTGTSGCSTSHTIRAYDRELWDIGLGLSVLGVKEPQYAPSDPQTQIAPKNNAGTVFGFVNFYPFFALGNKTSYYPSIAAGIPVTGKVFYQPFFGLSEGILGWWKRAPLPINVLWGVVYLNQEKAMPNLSGVNQIGHSRVHKQMFAVELPVSALVSKIKSLGGSGSSTNSSGSKSSGTGSQ